MQSPQSPTAKVWSWICFLGSRYACNPSIDSLQWKGQSHIVESFEIVRLVMTRAAVCSCLVVQHHFNTLSWWRKLLLSALTLGGDGTILEFIFHYGFSGLQASKMQLSIHVAGPSRWPRTSTDRRGAKGKCLDCCRAHHRSIWCSRNVPSVGSVL